MRPKTISKTQADNTRSRIIAAAEARRKQVPTVVNWDEAIARWLDMLNEIYGPG